MFDDAEQEEGEERKGKEKREFGFISGARIIPQYNDNTHEWWVFYLLTKNGAY